MEATGVNASAGQVLLDNGERVTLTAAQIKALYLEVLKGEVAA